MEIQQVEQKKKEQLMREILLGMNDRAFDKFFSEVYTLSDGECRKRFHGIGLLETLHILYGEARNIREAKENK